MKTIKTLVITLAMIAFIAGGSAALADSGSLSANFMANVNTGAAPLTVHFTDKSVGSPTGWQWDFGDGSYSTLQNPVYTYNTPGRYTVTLTSTDGAQSDTISADILVTSPLAITPTPSPVRTPVIVQPILVPVKDPHHAQPPHKEKPPVKEQPPTHKQPHHPDQPVHKQPPTHKSPQKPTDKPKHK
ncbi:MAG TPA: PKD domain-containing protein [Methanocella sp.]|jgi:PKD repeat protein